jgi:lysozyme
MSSDRLALVERSARASSFEMGRAALRRTRALGMDVILGPRGIALIRGTEELRLVAYLPTINDVWTIGWGHTKGVHMGTTSTGEQAEEWFREDVAGPVAAVNAVGVPLSQGMFDALVSLVFEAGEGAIAPDSTVGAALRRRDYFGAWRGMALWTKQAGKDLRGLASRRAEEMALFMDDPLPASS